MNLATIFVFPLAFQRMRASWTALVNKPLGLAQHTFATTVFLLLLSCYFGISFTDIAVIKMIKGATLGVSIMFIMPGLAYLGISSQDQAASDPWDTTGDQTPQRKEFMKNEPVSA